jgi:DNA-binding HxlR family transcriptional regulator
VRETHVRSSRMLLLRPKSSSEHVFVIAGCLCLSHRDLAFRSLRHAELLRLLPGVSQKVLTVQLRELERDGVVARLDAERSPPRVDYFLTDSGKELIHIMDVMCGWATKHLGVTATLPPRPEMIPTQPSGI